jgi:hypothetical protein
MSRRTLINVTCPWGPGHQYGVGAPLKQINTQARSPPPGGHTPQLGPENNLMRALHIPLLGPDVFQTPESDSKTGTKQRVGFIASKKYDKRSMNMDNVNEPDLRKPANGQGSPELPIILDRSPILFNG